MGYKFGIIGISCKAKQNKKTESLKSELFWLLSSEMKPLKECHKNCNSI